MEAIAEKPFVPPYISDRNPLGAGFALNPFPVYKELREAGPVIWLEKLGVWGVFRDSLVRELLTDFERFTSKGGTGLQNNFREKPWREPSVVQDVDPPEHGRTRSIFTRVLSPGALNRLKKRFADDAERVVDRILEKGGFDGVDDFAKIFPVKVFLDAVGVPDGERDNVLIYNDLVRKSRTIPLDQWDPSDRKTAEGIAVWIDKFCSRESVAPNSFGSEIYASVDAGEITEHEGRLMVRTFISAGTETTIAAIASTLYYLVTNPDQWDVVKADPAKVRPAFEEALRIDPPAQFGGRCASEAMEWEGVRIGKHDKILGFIAAANRDPARWADPDKYLVSRSTIGHLGLGTGIHGCVGQMLARLESEVLLKALFSRVDALELTGEPVRNRSGFRGFQSLPMRVSQVKSK